MLRRLFAPGVQLIFKDEWEYGGQVRMPMSVSIVLRCMESIPIQIQYVTPASISIIYQCVDLSRLKASRLDSRDMNTTPFHSYMSPPRLI